MVSEELRIVVRAEAQQAITQLNRVQGTAGKVTSGFAAMAKSLVGPASVAIAMGAVVKISKQMVTAFGEQEEAEARLTAAIKATGKEGEISADRLKTLAGELQKVTTFGDEATIAATGMLQQLANLNQEGLEKIIPNIQDFAAAMNLDLNTAATLVGKTLGSTTNALTRYGIEIDTSLPKNEKLIAVAAQIEEKFGGAAEAIAATSKGMRTQLSNAMGDLMEAGGQFISTFLDPLVVGLTKAVTLMTNLLNGMGTGQLPPGFQNENPADILNWAKGGKGAAVWNAYAPPGGGGATTSGTVASNMAADRMMGLFTHRLAETLWTLPASANFMIGAGTGPETSGMFALRILQNMAAAQQLYGAPAGGFGGALPGGVPGVGSPYGGITPDLSGVSFFPPEASPYGKFFPGYGKQGSPGRMGDPGLALPHIPFSMAGYSGQRYAAGAAGPDPFAGFGADMSQFGQMMPVDAMNNATTQMAQTMQNSLVPAAQAFGKAWAESGSAIQGAGAAMQSLGETIFNMLPQIFLQLAIQTPDTATKALLIGAAITSGIIGGVMGGSRSSMSGGAGSVGSKSVTVNVGGSLVTDDQLTARIEEAVRGL